MFSSLVILLALISPVSGLICLNNEEGIVLDEDCSTCTYCIIAGEGLTQTPVKLFGVDESMDSTKVYNVAFDLSGVVAGPLLYSVRSSCLYEKMEEYSPEQKLRPRYTFRCACNWDRCNNGTDFVSFMENLKF